MFEERRKERGLKNKSDYYGNEGSLYAIWTRPMFNLVSRAEIRAFIYGVLMCVTSWVPLVALNSVCTVRGIEMAWAAPGITLFSMCVIPVCVKYLFAWILFHGYGEDWKHLAERYTDNTLGISRFPLLPTAGFIFVVRGIAILTMRILQKPLIIGKPWKMFRKSYPNLLLIPEWWGDAFPFVWWHRGEYEPFLPRKEEIYTGKIPY